MSDQSGTPNPAPESVNTTANQDASGKDGSEQKWQEALKWKEKAEAFNKLEAEKRQMEQRLAELERVAYSGGVQAATDPTAELVQQLQEQAQYDAAAKAALLAMQESAKARAEQWLMSELFAVPENKRAKVAALIRSQNYQLGVHDALEFVNDPDAATYQQRVSELQAENERLKSRAPLANGSAPMAAYPASDAAAPKGESMPWSEMQSALRRGGEAARSIRHKWDSGEIKPDYSR
jgi:vacuolar-type H+-ATPase subunit I/STV1